MGPVGDARPNSVRSRSRRPEWSRGTEAACWIGRMLSCRGEARRQKRKAASHKPAPRGAQDRPGLRRRRRPSGGSFRRDETEGQALRTRPARMCAAPDRSSHTPQVCRKRLARRGCHTKTRLAGRTFAARRQSVRDRPFRPEGDERGSGRCRLAKAPARRRTPSTREGM